MAEAKNIKELPKSDSITSGDYFLIETPAGTELLDFDNFVIDQDNTTFAAELQTNVTTLSTAVTAVSASVDMTNTDSNIYIINTTLTSKIDNINNTLYGTQLFTDPSSTFESVLQNKRDGASVDPVTQNTRDLGSHLQALSAMVFDELYSRIQTLSADVVGDISNITDRSNLKYDSSGSSADPASNSGGLLGIILDTAMDGVDVYLGETTGVFDINNKDTISISMNIDNRYIVGIGSLQYTIQFTNSAGIGITGPTPYTDPGSFIIINYNETVSGSVGTYQWTIKRVGGQAFPDDTYPIQLNGRVVASLA